MLPGKRSSQPTFARRFIAHVISRHNATRAARRIASWIPTVADDGAWGFGIPGYGADHDPIHDDAVVLVELYPRLIGGCGDGFCCKHRVVYP